MMRFRTVLSRSVLAAPVMDESRLLPCGVDIWPLFQVRALSTTEFVRDYMFL
jgi:hypothetical protein